MIPLGSCTMKLNATSEMLPVTWPEFGGLHPFCPADQAEGYRTLFTQLEGWLAEITGFAAVSLEPNAGSQGEYAGLLVIRAVPPVARRRASQRLPHSRPARTGRIPPAPPWPAMKVVAVKCLADGNIDLADLRAKAAEHAHDLAALMITYPSTHGVFEETIARGLRDHPRARRAGLSWTART